MVRTGEQTDIIIDDSDESNDRANDVAEPDLEVLIFQLGSEYFAIDISHIEEIRIPATLTPIPRAKPFVLGIITLRGILFPVIDLGLFFAMKAVERTVDSRIIVFDRHDEMIGFLVDQVIGVRRMFREKIRSINEATNIERESYGGVFDFNDTFCAYLDLDKILESPHLEKFYREREHT